jgi:hypothetical protein
VVAAATAAATVPYYGGSLQSWLRAAERALSTYQVILEAELVTAEASWNAASTDVERANRQDVLDVAAGRLTYCIEALGEVDRALSLLSMSDLIGVP